MKRELTYKLIRMPLAWLGIVLIVIGFAVLIRQPIQVEKWYWVEILNYVTALGIAGIGTVIIGLRIIVAHREYMREVDRTRDEI